MATDAGTTFYRFGITLLLAAVLLLQLEALPEAADSATIESVSILVWFGVTLVMASFMASFLMSALDSALRLWEVST